MGLTTCLFQTQKTCESILQPIAHKHPTAHGKTEYENTYKFTQRTQKSTTHHKDSHNTQKD